MQNLQTPVLSVQVCVAVIGVVCLQRAAIKTRKPKLTYPIFVEQMISVYLVLRSASCMLADKGLNSSHKSQTCSCKKGSMETHQGKRGYSSTEVTAVTLLTVNSKLWSRGLWKSVHAARIVIRLRHDLCNLTQNLHQDWPKSNAPVFVQFS